MEREQPNETEVQARAATPTRSRPGFSPSPRLRPFRFLRAARLPLGLTSLRLTQNRFPTAVFGLLAALQVLVAQPVTPLDLGVTATSVSGQFIVHGRGPDLPAPKSVVKRVGTNDVIELRPDLLAVTAERVKRAVERKLGASDRWQGNIHLQMGDADKLSGPILIQAQVFRDGWQYRVAVPDRVGWERLIRALTEVVLLERANRQNTGMDCAIVPLWLTGGVTELLLAAGGRDLVMESATMINRSELKPDPLQPVRAALRGREPMPFSELSLVTLEELSDPRQFAFFEASAALFTHELLRDDAGCAGLREFLRLLPASLNWQTAFLQAYPDRFSSLLDVEKWWALASTETLATEPSQRWSRDKVLGRLAELFLETAEVRATNNTPAARRNIPLRELVVTWDYATQRDVVRRKAAQIRALSMRAPPDVAPLVRDSAKVLEDYLAIRDRSANPPPGRMQLEVRGQMVAETTAKKLVTLERRLEQERRAPQPYVPAPANPAGAVPPPGRPSPPPAG
jgi:hypothetical protein